TVSRARASAFTRCSTAERLSPDSCATATYVLPSRIHFSIWIDLATDSALISRASRWVRSANLADAPATAPAEKTAFRGGFRHQHYNEHCIGSAFDVPSYDADCDPALPRPGCRTTGCRPWSSIRHNGGR